LLSFTAVFASLVFLNYIVQTTIIPALARNYTPASSPSSPVNSNFARMGDRDVGVAFLAGSEAQELRRHANPAPSGR
jgi:hypothetical protein